MFAWFQKILPRTGGFFEQFEAHGVVIGASSHALSRLLRGEDIRKRYWGQRFWARGYFSTTSGNITDEVILNYLDKHTAPSKPGFSPAS